MRITDCHVHTEGDVDVSDLLKRLDDNGIDRMLVMSSDERVSLMETRRKLLQTKALFDAAPDRIDGLAWVNPVIPGMCDLTEEALTDMGYVGVKIIPDHWYAYEGRLESFWERMNSLHAHIIFHTGILYYYDDGSRFCQPLWLETLVNYPNIHFAMAHMSWPWCEENLAVMGRMRNAASIGGWEWQSYVDITVGTPPHIHKQALKNAIDFCGVERIMWGSDAVIPGDLTNQKFRVEHDAALLDELGLDDAQKQRIMSGTADEVFPPRR